METAGIAEIKARLSEYLVRVRSGAEVVVTDRGRPVAKLVPVTGLQQLGELERQGLIRSGPMSLPDGFLERPRSKPAGPGLTEALIEERREGR